MTHSRTGTCACGRVELTATGDPILSAVCYCDDCQAGAARIEALPNAPRISDPDGGTPLLTYRDDRIACTKGAELLQGFKLKEKTSTQRFVATCCNTGMYLKFALGHWTSAYAKRFKDAPPLQMRTQAKFLRQGHSRPTDVPTYDSYPLSLFAKLAAARISMWRGR